MTPLTEREQRLLDALYEQWWDNHDEHCMRLEDCTEAGWGKCCWHMPPVLQELKAEVTPQ